MIWPLFSIFRTVAVAYVSIVACAGCIARAPEDKPICGQPVLDESAGVNFVAGMPVHISPRSIVKSTVCQTTWDSKGRITMQIVFSEGEVVQYIEYAATGTVELNCQYAKGTAQDEKCPFPKDLSQGFMVLDKDTEKSIPNFNDLRF
jgi:hypothetical protein